MAEKKKIKLNIKADTALLIVFFLVVAGYVIFHIYSAVNVELETVTAVKSTVYETVETKALVIRDEQLINEQADELTVACVEDGEKVKVNGNIAMRFSSTESAANYSKLKDLHSQLDQYIELQNRNSATATDVRTLDKETLNEVNSYIRAASYGDINSLSSHNAEINEKLIKYQMLIGEKIDFSTVTKNLQEQINGINAASAEPTGYITTDKSGVFSSYIDGLESAFDYGNVRNLTVKELNSYFEKAEKNESTGGSFGKLINSYEWYMCCVVNTSDISDIKNGDVIEVAVKDTDAVLDCVVVSGADVPLGQEQTVLVLRSSQMDSTIAAMRYEDIEIHTAAYTGFKLPSSVIHVNDNGEKCVYALVSNKAVERQSKIIYSTKDFVVLYDDEPTSKSIRYYDQIITKGKELHDGKDYSG